MTSDNLCRVCLIDGPTIPIFHSEIKEYRDIPSKFHLCLGEEILDLPGYPRNMCEECYKLLNQAVSFNSKYRETCLTLEKVIKQGTIIDHSDINGESDIEALDYLCKNDIMKSEFDCNNEAKCNVEENKDIITNNILDQNLLNKKLQTKKKISKFKRNTKCLTTAVLKQKLEFLSKNGDMSIKSIIKSKKVRKRATESKAAKKNISGNTNYNYNNNKTRRQCKELTLSEKPSVLCDQCGKSFQLKIKLRQHIIVHHSEKNSLECPVCKKIYSSELALSRHKKRMHKRDKKICSDCGKAFSCDSELEKHYKCVHLKMRSYKKRPCKFCGKEYITNKSLLVHERSVHTGERPAICTVCEASFVHDEYLTQHMRLHTGETPFKCPICGRGYAQSGNMKSHIKHNHRISQLDETMLKTINPRYLKFMKP